MATAPLKNMLLQDVKYKTEETAWGRWRRFGYADGRLFEEFVSHMMILGMPLIHYTRGKCPETGRSVVAKGFLAVGRISVGVVAIGQASAGVFAVGQASMGLLFGLGQATCGVVTIGQLSLGLLVGLGQFATGYVAIGQMAVGFYVLAQVGIGPYVWDIRAAAPAAAEFFRGFVSIR
jgi:hypothetical protein